MQWTQIVQGCCMMVTQIFKAVLLNLCGTVQFYVTNLVTSIKAVNSVGNYFSFCFNYKISEPHFAYT